MHAGRPPYGTLFIFQRAERHPLGRVQALTNQGIWYRRQRDFDTAADKLRQALALEPRRAKTRQLLADLRLHQVRTLLAEERPEAALQACVEGIREVGDARLVQLCSGLAPD